MIELVFDANFRVCLDISRGGFVTVILLEGAFPGFQLGPKKLFHVAVLALALVMAC